VELAYKIIESLGVNPQHSVSVFTSKARGVQGESVKQAKSLLFVSFALRGVTEH